ncbi:MAG: LysR family transcriptional regulator [Puniceicoccales bacterium]|jgi:DNA-binding transcriptional LysR family regulator|nr:LysR family transcriptional regulator [Puniceicoccales bacterium]
MELRHLRYFLAVAEELNFRRAGERLHVSHPTLSKQIGDLEHSLGIKLLERDTVSVHLTSAGRDFLQDARKLLAQVDTIVDKARRTAAEPSVITIGVPGPLAADNLLKALAVFRRRYPRINLQMVETFGKQQLSELHQGKIQLGFAVVPDMQAYPGLEAKLLLQSPVGVVLGRNHPLAAKKTLTCDDLLGETFLYLGVGKNAAHRNEIRQVLPLKILKGARFKSAPSAPTMLLLLGSCEGVSLLPREFVQPVQKQVVYRKLSGCRIGMDFKIWAIWRKDESNPTVRELITML